MAHSSDTGKLSVSAISSVLETGRIREGYTEAIQPELDGVPTLFFVNPETLALAKERKEGSVVVIDENGLERGIPLEMAEG